MYTTFTPKNRELAEKLARKLESASVAAPSVTGKDEPGLVEWKLREVSQRLKMMQVRSTINEEQLQKYAQNIEHVLHSVEHSRNKNDHEFSRLLEGFENYAQSEQNSNSQKLAIVRKALIEDFDSKKKAMKSDAIDIIEQDFQEICKTNLAQVDKKMKEVVTMLEQEQVCKEESASDFAHTIGEEIIKMEQMIMQERETRKERNQSIFDMLAQLEEQIDGQITQEIKAREKCEMQIEDKLGLICSRIEHKILGTF